MIFSELTQNFTGGGRAKEQLTGPGVEEQRSTSMAFAAIVEKFWNVCTVSNAML